MVWRLLWGYGCGESCFGVLVWCFGVLALRCFGVLVFDAGDVGGVVVVVVVVFWSLVFVIFWGRCVW